MVARKNPPMFGLKIIGNNMIEVQHGDITVLYSYETPVAMLAPSGLWRTDTHHSNTTARHIGKWFRHHDFDPARAARVSQDVINVAASQGVDPEKVANLQSLSKKMSKPKYPGHQPNPALLAYND